MEKGPCIYRSKQLNVSKQINYSIRIKFPYQLIYKKKKKDRRIFQPSEYKTEKISNENSSN